MSISSDLLTNIAMVYNSTVSFPDLLHGSHAVWEQDCGSSYIMLLCRHSSAAERTVCHRGVCPVVLAGSSYQVTTHADSVHTHTDSVHTHTDSVHTHRQCPHMQTVSTHTHTDSVLPGQLLQLYTWSNLHKSAVFSTFFECGDLPLHVRD